MPQHTECCTVDDDTECVVAMVDAIQDTCVTEEMWMDASSTDENLCKIKQFISNGWPSTRCLAGELRNFALVADELTSEGNLVLRNDLFVPPPAVRRPLIEAAHADHLGITKTVMNLRQFYWWPSLEAQVKHFV